MPQISTGKDYSLVLEDLFERFDTNPIRGLKATQVEHKILEYGQNELPKLRRSIWKVYLAPIFNFLILILIITSLIIIILGRWELTIFTFSIVIINSITAIIQQYRARKALESLKRLTAMKARVIRDSEQTEVPSIELVPGDLIIIEKGDKIPADGRIISQVNLSVDESILTGESHSIEKSTETLENIEIPIENRKNQVFMGTFVQTGRATVVVTKTGVNTEIGKISFHLSEKGTIEDIPLTKKMNKIGYALSIIVLINLIFLIIFKFSQLIQQGLFYEVYINSAIIDSIVRAMNVIPINLPLLTTIILITGVLKMANTGVIIKNLAAIESLGRVSVICTDKTGTITKNEMTVKKLWINTEEYDISGSGYDPIGEVSLFSNRMDLSSNGTFEKLIASMILNNNASLIYEGIKIRASNYNEMSVRKALGSPTEASLLVLSEKLGYDVSDVRKNHRLLREFSFSSKLKKMTSIVYPRYDKSELYVFSKGAPETILEISSKIEIDDKVNRMTSEHKNEILEHINQNASSGYRTLGFCYKKIKTFEELKRKNIEKDMIFLGFVSILDPPRLEVKSAIQKCQRASIKIIMLTGDHPATAQKIAQEMKILTNEGVVIEGKLIRDLNEKELERFNAFARVSPMDKELILNFYQKQDKICVMTGDGINDAPALRAANCGIAMGIKGTDLAKDAADIVITDDDFASIQKGIEIGRGIFSKIRVIIYFFICLNIMEAIIFLGYEINPSFILFSSNWQHYYIFTIVHSIPAIGLVLERLPFDVMNEPPRDKEGILSKPVSIMLLLQAFLMGIGLVLALELSLNGIIGLNEWNINYFGTLSYIPDGTTNQQLVEMKARTMFITTLYIMETMFVWSFRRPNKSIFKSIKEEPSYVLLVACVATLFIHFSLIFFSYRINYLFNDLLGLNLNLNFLFLSLDDWIICILLAIPGIFGIEIYKLIMRRLNVLL